ncbi:hypothetical protein BD779DRAFT_19110 [Infundibulicybe gibba]|nr:hypothetical protein BD779DRAFT_19110 [Infundibulicybe gibba]
MSAARDETMVDLNVTIPGGVPMPHRRGISGEKIWTEIPCQMDHGTAIRLGRILLPLNMWGCQAHAVNIDGNPRRLNAICGSRYTFAVQVGCIDFCETGVHCDEMRRGIHGWGQLRQREACEWCQKSGHISVPCDCRVMMITICSPSIGMFRCACVKGVIWSTIGVSMSCPDK